MEKSKISKSEKRIIKYWAWLGMILVMMLAFWTSDWDTHKLPQIIIGGIVCFYMIAIPVGGGAMRITQDKEKEG